MKKQLAHIALLLGFVFILATSGSAQKTKPENNPNIPLVAKFGLYQMSNGQIKRVAGQRTISSTPGKKLHGIDILTMTGASCLLHLGSKWPIVYYDPRAEQFQIQYVDIGMKLDVTIKEKSPGLFNLRIRPETSTLQGLKAKGELAAYPKTAPFIIESEIPSAALEQTLVLGYASGPSARSFLANEGLDTENDNIVYTLRLERP